VISEEEVKNTVARLRNDVRMLDSYAKMKTGHQDRHGVTDAQTDARELEAMVDALLWVLGEVPRLP